jgi:type IV secretory pathway ATPase VirB11/archaellum biosynthesis ATPase
MKPFSSTLGHTIVLGNNGKTSSGKTTLIKAGKVCTKQLEQLYTIEDVNELRIKTIGFLIKK